MPHHKGVFAASLVLIVCLGTNMSAFPEVWHMFSSNSLPEIATLPATLPSPTLEPEKITQTLPKSMRTDKPIPIDPPAPKKNALQSDVAQPVPVPEKEKTPATNLEELAPYALRDGIKPGQDDATERETTTEKEATIEKETTTEKETATEKETTTEKETGRLAAFAPVVPPGLQDLNPLESLLPNVETVDPFMAESTESASTTTPSYSQEFKPMPRVEAKRTDPVFETIDSVLAQPIVYESYPSINQRVVGQREFVPSSPSTGTAFRPLTSISPTGPVRRLPSAD